MNIQPLIDAQRIILVGHQNIDPDSWGSQAALYQVLRALDKDLLILNHEQVDSNLAPFYKNGGHWVPEPDLVVLLDCSSLDRVGSMGPVIRDMSCPVMVIDHHLYEGDEWWDHAIRDTRASATGVLVYRIAKDLGIELNDAAREGVFRAIMNDTGWLRYSNTDPETLSVVSDLDINFGTMFERINQQKSRGYAVAVGQALAQARFSHNGRVAHAAIKPGVPSHDVLDILRAEAEVKLVILSMNTAEGIRISARSKGEVNCAELMECIGGGGHARAAGGVIRCKEDRDRLNLALDAAIMEVRR